MICSAPAVRSEATAYFSDERHAIAAEAMANAANDFNPEAVCGGKWKNKRKTVEKQLKRAAKAELRTQLGLSWVGMLLVQWVITAVFKWFTNKYLG